MRLPSLVPWGLPAFYAVAATGVSAGTALALWGALQGYPYWIDEMWALVASQEPLVVGMQRLILPDIHPPLYYWTLSAWTWVFGTTEVAARSLSALGALGALGLIWWMGRAMLSRPALAMASLWLATHWMWIIYAQEARSYGLVFLGGAWVSLRFTQLWNDENPPPSALSTFAILSTLAALLHYSAMTLSCSALLLLLLRHRRRPSLWLPLVLAGGICVLWTLWHGGHMRLAAVEERNDWISNLPWGDWPGPIALLTVLWTIFFPGRSTGADSLPSLPLVAVWLALVGFYAFFVVEWWRRVRRAGGWAGWKASVAGPDWSFLRSQLLLLGLCFATLALVHQFWPVLTLKMLAACFPGMLLCLGCLAVILWRSTPWRLSAVAAVLLALSLPVGIYAAEKRWLRGSPLDRGGLLEIAARLEGGAPGRVYCHRCHRLVGGYGPEGLALTSGLRPGTFAPVAFPFTGGGATQERHMIPPFFLTYAMEEQVSILQDDYGLQMEILTPGVPQGEFRHPYLSIYVTAPD